MLENVVPLYDGHERTNQILFYLLHQHPIVCF